ncbi:fibronectin type III domain-containing protein, partial [Candidatus Woesearchaeota archaeon]|nr:fibronectin type III domain-containing protein [Candidatus Woesearchaeota archaeon]
MTDAKLCQIALFIIWLIVLTPVYTASALEINFNPNSDVQVTDVSALISWSTDEPSTGIVEYGVESGVMERESSGATGTEHSVELTGVASQATFRFFFEISNGTDTLRRPVEGGDFYSFTTEAPRDRTPPRAITGLAAPTITANSITIVWERDTSDEDIDHYNIYKNDDLLSDDVSSKTYTDTGLDASVEYVYKVSAVDFAGNEGPKTTQRATTRSEDYQQISVSG